MVDGGSGVDFDGRWWWWWSSSSVQVVVVVVIFSAHSGGVDFHGLNV